MLWPRLERDRNISRTENVGQDPPSDILPWRGGESDWDHRQGEDQAQNLSWCPDLSLSLDTDLLT